MPPSPRRKATPRQVAVRGLALLAALLLGCLLWTGLALLSVRGDVDTARADLTAVGAGTGDAAAGRAALMRAERRLDRAQGRLTAPGPAVVAALPLLGRTPRAVLASVRAAHAAARAGARVLTAATEGPPLVTGGALDLAGLQRLSQALAAGRAEVTGPVHELDAVPTGWTPGVVQHGVADLRSRLDGLPDQLGSASAAVGALAGLTGGGGDRRLLLVLENNAELRGSGGLVTIFAEAVAHDGRLQVGRFRDVEEVADPAARVRRVPAPADYLRLWGPYLANSTLWKNTNMAPDLPTSSQVLADVAGASLGHRPDGIIWLDVPALAAVIGATSPARLPDGSLLTATSTVPALLSAAYQGAVDTTAGQAARRARLRAAADAVASRLLLGSVSVVKLGPALATAARGRHVAVWSDRPAEQRAWEQAGLAGAVRAGDGDIASFAVQNFGGGQRQGNKLDYYGRRLVSVHVRLTGTQALVEQEVALRNTAPSRGLPVYVAGLDAPGTMNDHVTMALPARAVVTGFTRGGVAVRSQVLPENDHLVVSDLVSIAPGSTVTWRLTYRLPLAAGAYALRLFPQPLAVDAGLSLDVAATAGVHLDAPGDTVHRSGPLTTAEQVVVHVRPAGVLTRAADAVRRFWREPVRLP